ncbi:MAG: DNA gyrase inhibitor YacG [Marinibacterium sp.]|nr:DNA gyrase inhibitor YacG [Marinibacterium sp.]
MSCPVCSKPTAQDWRPFCSHRCADLDLGKWMTGAYVLPANDETEEDSLPEPPITKPH